MPASSKIHLDLIHVSISPPVQTYHALAEDLKQVDWHPTPVDEPHCIKSHGLLTVKPIASPPKGHAGLFKACSNRASIQIPGCGLW
jgi:hypothetical protein